MVGTVIWRATGKHDCVEDLAQETFLRVFRGLAHFDGCAKLSTWIYTIAHRVAVDHGRQQSVRLDADPTYDRKARLKADIVHDGAERIVASGFSRASSIERNDPERLAGYAELDRIVRRELSQMPDKYRLPLEYATIEELDYETIAAMLKVKPPTVKTLVFRARQMLRERVDTVLRQRKEKARAT
jgi:RNA polymerase sigma-70 factor (ECF subfamily)